MIEAKHLLVDTNVWLDYYLQEGGRSTKREDWLNWPRQERSTFCMRQRRQRMYSIFCLGV